MNLPKIISPTPLPQKFLINSLYGEPLDDERSREHRENSQAYMADYFKALGEYVDQLSSHTVSEIDALHVDALRHNDCKKAATVYGWHGLFSPFRANQSPYIDTKRLRQLVLNNGETTYELAAFITGGVNAEYYALLQKLNPKLAADYFKHSLMYSYEHLSDKEVVEVVTMAPENTNGLPALSLDQEVVSWGEVANEGNA